MKMRKDICMICGVCDEICSDEKDLVFWYLF